MGPGLLAGEQPGATQPQLVDPLPRPTSTASSSLAAPGPVPRATGSLRTGIELGNFTLAAAESIGQSAIGRCLLRQLRHEAVGIAVEIELAQSERLDQRLVTVDRGDAVVPGTSFSGDGGGLLQLAEAAGKSAAILGPTRKLALSPPPPRPAGRALGAMRSTP